MPTAPSLKSFRDPAFSLWQSAIHATLLKQQPQLGLAAAPGGGGLSATANHPIMLASVQAMQQMQIPPAPPAGPAPVAAVAPMAGRAPAASALAASPVTTILDCAKLGAEIAWD